MPSSNEYMGTINFCLPRAGIRLNPDTPSFIVDAGVELANPIPLGITVLGFYGFRGLFESNRKFAKPIIHTANRNKCHY